MDAERAGPGEGGGVDHGGAAGVVEHAVAFVVPVGIDVEADQAAGFGDFGDGDFAGGGVGADFGDVFPAGAGGVGVGGVVGSAADLVAQGDLGDRGVGDAERVFFRDDFGVVVVVEFDAEVAVAPGVGAGGDEGFRGAVGGAAVAEADRALDFVGG